MDSSNQKLHIRPGLLTDLPTVRRIEIDSFDDPWSDNALGGELLADDLRLPLVAVLDDHVVGYMMSWRVVDQLHVLNIAVDRGQLRRGIATDLLREAAVQALESGLREMTLEVRRGNDSAVAFYIRHGFIEVGVREGYYAESGEDALIMNCPLDQLGAP